MKQNPRLHQKDNCFFRAGVGAIIIAPSGRVLACQRRKEKTWQLPQGGINPRETEYHAILREIGEETRIKAAQLSLLGVHPLYLSYRLPDATKKHGIGQTHRWFAFRYSGGEMPKLPKGGEFRSRMWMRFFMLERAVIDIKKPVYRHLHEWLQSLGPEVKL